MYTNGFSTKRLKHERRIHYKKRALITGIIGWDGAYLAELLLDKGNEVHGIKRRSPLFNTDRIDHLYVDPHEKKSPIYSSSWESDW